MTVLAKALGRPVSPAVEAKFQRLLDQAREKYPAVKASDADVAAQLARGIPGGEALEAALEAISAPDLYLAAACARSDAAALAEAERSILSRLGPAIGKVNSADAFVEEVTEQVRLALFFSRDGARPRVAEFSGRGSLLRWTKAAAVRLAINASKRAGREVSAASEAERAAFGDPELELLRARYKRDFQAAFAEAFASLTARERNVLRMQLIDQLSIDSIAQVFRTHRATAARWLVAAREALVKRTRRALAERLKLSPRELESLVAAVKSQLDLSITRLLKHTRR